MKQYTIGKKAAVIVVHQLCMILMVTGVFATGYAFRHDAHENIDIYCLLYTSRPSFERACASSLAITPQPSVAQLSCFM